MVARAVPPIPSFAFQEAPTSGKINQFGIYLSWWSNRPMFRMYQSASQSVPNNAFTQILMDVGTGAAAWDTDSGRAATSPWSFVIPVALSGRWNFRWKVGFATNTTGARLSALYQNGAVATGGQMSEAAATTSTDIVAASMTVLCNAGDTMAVYGLQTSGAALLTDVGNAGAVSFFEGSFESFASP